MLIEYFYYVLFTENVTLNVIILIGIQIKLNNIYAMVTIIASIITSTICKIISNKIVY